MGTLRVGSEIIITAKDHPHYRETGTIKEATDVMDFDWIVDLNGQWAEGCFVSSREIRDLDTL